MNGTDTDWITVGAPVLVYRQDYGKQTGKLRETAVDKVNRKTFTVAGVEERFEIEDQRTKQLGSKWTGYRYVAIPADSGKAAELRDEADRENRLYVASAAVDKWRRTGSRADRLDAIEALQQVKD